MSEELDDETLGQDIGDQDPAGLHDYPPERSMGVEDPNLAGDDDVATRSLRKEVDPTRGEPPPQLRDPEGGMTRDDEEQELGEDVPAASELPAEEAAMHIDDDSTTP